jgi:hypothetical protein
VAAAWLAEEPMAAPPVFHGGGGGEGLRLAIASAFEPAAWAVSWGFRRAFFFVAARTAASARCWRLDLAPNNCFRTIPCD